MKNVLQRLFITAGIFLISVASAYSQMNILRQQQMQQMRRMEMQEHRNAKPLPEYGAPLMEIESVVMPDGHIVEYHHINRGPVIEDSIPYLFEMKLHWVPFVAMKQSRLDVGQHISSSPFKPGFSVGTRADWYKDVRSSFYLSTGLNYTRMNLFYEAVGAPVDYSISIEMRVHSFYIPILVGYQFRLDEKMKVGLGLGAQFGAYIRVESEEKGRIYSVNDDIFDATVGPELWFSYKHWQVGLQYDWGFQDVSYRLYRFCFMDDETSNRQTMTLSIGYRLWNE